MTALAQHNQPARPAAPHRAAGDKHDAARARFAARPTVEDLADFKHAIAEYYTYHFATCVEPDARLPKFAAQERAQAIVENDYRSRRLGISNACADAIQGTNGGLDRMYDLIRDALKRGCARDS